MRINNKLFYIILGVLVVFTSCQKSKQVQYIAHGGGWIDGIPCPNCVEAVEWSLANGIKYIELDLRLTSDSQLVAMHDWKFFHALTDEAYISDSSVLAIMHNVAEFDKFYRSSSVDSSPLRFADVPQRKIAGKYTPITYIWIDSLMRYNDTVWLVTDKLSNPELINRWLYPYRDRVMVECFSENDYRVLSELGYTCMLSDFYFPNKEMMSWSKGFRKQLRIWKNHKTMPTSFACSKRKPVEAKYCSNIKRRLSYKRMFGRWFAIYSVDNRSEADSIAQLDNRIKYVYINNIEL